MDVITEAERVRSEAQAAIADFLLVEIETGLMFCRIAQGEQERAKRDHALEQARKAYTTAKNGIRKLKLKRVELDKFKLPLGRLKSELTG